MSDLQKHARLSPSGAERWMTCSGSVALEDGKPDDYNEYSDEGTCAHAIGAMCLTENRPATAYIGRRVSMDDDGPPRTYEFREDMAEPVQRYVDRVHEAIKAYQLAGAVVELHVEQALPIGHITREEGAEGTGDVVLVVRWPDLTEMIEVRDLKFGMGVRVSAEKNKQLMLYALGAIEKFDVTGATTRARLVIDQPRISDTPSEYECTVEELFEFSKAATVRADIAMTAFKFRANWIKDKDSDYLTPSADACRFCKAKAECPALSRTVEETVGAAFDVLVGGEYDTGETCPVPADRIGSVDLSTKLKAVGLIEDWCKAIRAEVERRLLAGEQVPEFKLVEGRQGNRAWLDAEATEKLFKETFRLKTEEMYDLSLISPTTAEKLKKAGVIGPRQWAKVESEITRKPGAKSVAHISDKRPAVIVTPVVDAFEDLTNVEDIT